MSPSLLTRRRLLQTSLAAGLLQSRFPAFGNRLPADTGWILIGTGQQGIYRAPWNSHTGEIGPAELAIATPQPTYLTLHPHLPVLYACNEQDAPAASISAFTLDRLRANLEPLAKQQTHGSAPCFVSVDRTGKLLFAANYGGGSLAVFPLDNAGKPAAAATVFECKGNAACGVTGPVKERQESPHLHCAVLSPDNRFLLACDLGDDAILIFSLTQSSISPLGRPARIQTAAGAGPRHLAFHPNGGWLYCINEINCTVSMYLWRVQRDRPAAKSVPDATVSIRPANRTESSPSTAAEIRISSDGRFLYTSTRFSDVLTVFSIHQTHGRLTHTQQVSCGGKTPRFFALDSTERWLVCANQDSNTITVFARAADSGRLTPASAQKVPSPECVLFV